MTEDTVQTWLDRYVAAWQANDPKLIGDLFTTEAKYHADPFDEGVSGRDAIIDLWLEVDMPTRFEADYRPVLVQGERAFASGYTRYFNPDGSLHSEWGNAFLLRFDPGGRCSEYREWYLRHKLPA